jgi:hypothetical protein
MHIFPEIHTFLVRIYMDVHVTISTLSNLIHSDLGDLCVFSMARHVPWSSKTYVPQITQILVMHRSDANLKTYFSSLGCHVVF